MDIKHYYIEKGCGQPLILLHGNGGSCEYFREQTDEFSDMYHVYAPDTRGHGKTPRGIMPFTIEQFADDLKGFMGEHGIERAHILGFSDGGNIAMQFAIKYPDMVDKLVLNGANLNAKGVKALFQIPIEIGYRMAKLFSGHSEAARLKKEMLELMVIYPPLSAKDLERIEAETLVIAGTEDMIKQKHTRLIADSIPHSTLRFIDGDHFIASKRSVEFNKAILDFLK